LTCIGGTSYCLPGWIFFQFSNDPIRYPLLNVYADFGDYLDIFYNISGKLSIKERSPIVKCIGVLNHSIDKDRHHPPKTDTQDLFGDILLKYSLGVNEIFYPSPYNP
jgi:hypothetical protein